MRDRHFHSLRTSPALRDRVPDHASGETGMKPSLFLSDEKNDVARWGSETASTRLHPFCSSF